MKIPTSVRNGYYQDLDVYKSLKTKVDLLVTNHKELGWHYLSRLKGLESYNLKIETGRYTKSELLDDFFACTLVVENLKAIERAEALLSHLFLVSKKKPPSCRLTHKKSDSFPFDDLRLYVKWQDADGIKPTGLDGLLFEVQIKTFLQHAWGIATHDMIYKSDNKNWAQERVAYQIKAMLEHAEVSIYEVGSIAQSSALNKSDQTCLKINKIIKLLNYIWEPADLPHDKKRLAENIHCLLSAVCLSTNDLKNLLIKEMDEGRGPRLLNLSPYAIIVQTLINTVPEKMIFFFNCNKSKFKLYIPEELQIPAEFLATVDENSIIVNFFSN